MPWTMEDAPDSMKNLPTGQRRKAIEIANAILRDGGDEGVAIATGISKAKAAGLVMAAVDHIPGEDDVDPELLEKPRETNRQEYRDTNAGDREGTGVDGMRTGSKMAASYQEFLDEYRMTPGYMDHASADTSDCVDFPEPCTTIEMKDSPIHGKGVFTTQDFPAGTPICLSHVGINRTPAGRYVNHSEMPNARVDKDGGNFSFVALEDIPKGTEVTTDYSDVIKALVQGVQKSAGLSLGDTLFTSTEHTGMKHAALREKDTGRVIVSWWNEHVDEAIKTGALKLQDMHGSAYKYAQQIGAMEPAFGSKRAAMNRTAALTFVDPASEAWPKFAKLLEEGPAGTRFKTADGRIFTKQAAGHYEDDRDELVVHTSNLHVAGMYGFPAVALMAAHEKDFVGQHRDDGAWLVKEVSPEEAKSTAEQITDAPDRYHGEVLKGRDADEARGKLHEKMKDKGTKPAESNDYLPGSSANKI